MREDWEVVKLGEFATHEKGKKPKNQKTKKDQVFEYPYVNIAAFEKGFIETYTDGEKCRFCFEDDFLMVWDGSRSGLVGKGINGALGSTIVRINFPGIKNDYAYHFLSSKYQDINTRAKGSGTPHVDPYLLWNYDFSIAPLPEQRAIVAKIEALFSDLDQGIADLKKAQDQLKVYRQAVLKKAFEGELTKEWRERNDSNWQQHLLGNIVKVSSGKGLTAKNMSGSGFPVYGGNGINGYHSEYLFEDEKLIIGRVGVRCGVTHITQRKSWVTDNALVVQFTEPKEYSLPFMKLKLQFENLNKLSSSTAQSVISGVKIYAYEISIPGINEQHQIVQEIESRLSVCDKVEKDIALAIERSRNLRQSILKKAFEGTLLSQEERATCKAAPDYEPASVLLARIERSRNEKIKAEKKKKP